MKRFSILLVIFTFTLILSNKVFSQSIWFVNPTNGADVTGLFSETQVAVNVLVNWQRSSNPNLISYKIKLFAAPIGTYESEQGNADLPQWFYLNPGTYQWRLELWEGDGIQGSVKTAEQTITFNVKHTFNVKNNFGYGIINVDAVQRNSPYEVKRFTGNTVTGGVIDQVYQTINRVWNTSGINNSDWRVQKKLGAYSNSLNQSRDYTYTLVSDDNGAALIANLRKVLNVSFQNSFVGIGNGGVIKVNNTQYNSPTSSFSVVELNPITGGAIVQTINGINYAFTQWSDGSTIATKTFNPSSTITYTAQHIGKPSTANRNLTSNTTVGQPVRLYWNDHQNANVTKVQIWRMVRHNGVTGSPQLLATINRGTTTYTDNEYSITPGYTDDLLKYDVRYYYLTEGTYSDASYITIYGEAFAKISDSTLASTKELENSLSNFPNPFNPATTIKFSIKENGFVNIKVFDLIGQQVAELVNEEKEAGSYSVSFDASNLPSGIYMYTIKTDNFVQTRKMLLMK